LLLKDSVLFRDPRLLQTAIAFLSLSTIAVLAQTADRPPIAKISVTPSSGAAPLTVTASISGSSDPDGTITSSTINFGDGTSTPGPIAPHTYSDSGTYTVAATVTDNAGLSSTATATVIVGGVLSDNTAFVTQQYVDFLDRQPDSAGLNAWTASLNSGSVTRAQLIADFMGSQEFAAKGLFVAQAYLGLLSRDADYKGFRGWLGWLEGGGTQLGLVNAFISSAEFQTNFGTNLSDAQFVTVMYQNVLLRQPDSGGLNAWVSYLASGGTRAQLARGFLQSAEFAQLRTSQNRVSISLLYFDMLRRPPDSSDFNGWVSALNSGTALNDEIAAFLNSAAYAARFTVTVQTQNDIQTASAWLATQQLSDGAIISAPDHINPYFANQAASGWLQDSTRYTAVGNYMQWYFNHVNRTTDVWGISGTIYDYAVSNAQTGGCYDSPCKADSTDSYASTFLSLAWSAWSTGDSGLRNLISSNRATLDLIAGVLTNPKSLDSSDGLTWAYPGYPYKYVSDNCEGYRGLSDYANLVQTAFGDSAAAANWNTAAGNMRNGILSFWNASTNTWAVDKLSSGAFNQANMTNWYPDAVAQIYPVVFGVVAPTDSQVVSAYASLNTAFQNWDTFQFRDSFPWTIVGYAATLMGDTTRANQYRSSVESKFVNVAPQFPYPWYDGEDGWFMRMVALQDKAGSS
jgi:PKD repeat protein